MQGQKKVTKVTEKRGEERTKGTGNYENRGNMEMK